MTPMSLACITTNCDVRAYGQAEVVAKWKSHKCEACHKVGGSSPMHSATTPASVDASASTSCADTGSGCHDGSDLHAVGEAKAGVRVKDVRIAHPVNEYRLLSVAGGRNATVAEKEPGCSRVGTPIDSGYSNLPATLPWRGIAEGKIAAGSHQRAVDSPARSSRQTERPRSGKAYDHLLPIRHAQPRCCVGA